MNKDKNDSIQILDFNSNKAGEIKMFFTKYKDKIEKLERDLSFWEKSCNELQEDINKIKEENKKLENINNDLNAQLINMNKLSKENEIMKKYYHLNEEPSIEVQARVLADLRIHDMEYQRLKEKIDELKTLRCSLLPAAVNPYYYHY